MAILNTTMLLLAWRLMYAMVLGIGHAYQRVLIIGAGVTGTILAEAFTQYPHYQAIGFIDDNRKLHGKVCQNIPVLDDRHNLSADINRYNVDEIVLAISRPIDEELLQLLTNFHERGIAIKLDSPGAIFYEQERVGQYGAKFTVYKFRAPIRPLLSQTLVALVRPQNLTTDVLSGFEKAGTISKQLKSIDLQGCA